MPPRRRKLVVNGFKLSRTASTIRISGNWSLAQTQQTENFKLHITSVAGVSSSTYLRLDQLCLHYVNYSWDADLQLTQHSQECFKFWIEMCNSWSNNWMHLCRHAFYLKKNRCVIFNVHFILHAILASAELHQSIIFTILINSIRVLP